MDLIDNPFHVLNASQIQSKTDIMDLYQEKSLFLDSEQCMQARLILTNPKKRLTAEVAWIGEAEFLAPIDLEEAELLGLDSMPFHDTLKVNELFGEEIDFTAYEDMYQKSLQQLNAWAAAAQNPQTPANLTGVSDLECKNLVRAILNLNQLNLAATLCKRCDQRVAYDLLQVIKNPSQLKQSVIVIAFESFDKLRDEVLTKVINKTRESSKFPEVTVEDVRDAMYDYQHELTSCLRKVMDNLPSLSVCELMAELINLYKSQGVMPSLLQSLYVQYELNADSFCKEQEPVLKKCLKDMLRSHLLDLPDNVCNYYYQQALQITKTMVTVIRPLNLKSKLDSDRNNSHLVRVFNSWSEVLHQDMCVYTPVAAISMFENLRDVLPTNECPKLNKICTDMLNELKGWEKDDDESKSVFFDGGEEISISNERILCANKCFYFCDVRDIQCNGQEKTVQITLTKGRNIHLSFSEEKVLINVANKLYSSFVLNIFFRWRYFFQLDVPIDFMGMTIWNEGIFFPFYMVGDFAHIIAHWSEMTVSNDGASFRFRGGANLDVRVEAEEAHQHVMLVVLSKLINNFNVIHALDVWEVDNLLDF